MALLSPMMMSNSPILGGLLLLTAGIYREQRAHLRGESEGRVCAANSGRNLPGSQDAESCALPVRKSTREKGLKMGWSVTAETPWGQRFDLMPIS